MNHAGNDKFCPVSTDSCIYPGDILTYECTVMGGHGGITVWKGTAFNCSQSDNEINLLHRRFQSDAVMCNNGTIVGLGIRVENNSSFTSQLNVTVTADVIGESVECVHDNGTLTTIRSSIVTASNGKCMHKL